AEAEQARIRDQQRLAEQARQQAAQEKAEKEAHEQAEAEAHATQASSTSQSSAKEESTTATQSSTTEESTTVPESSTTEESTTPAPTTPSTDQSVDTGNGTGSSTPAPTPTPTPEQPKPVTPAPAPSGSVNGAAIVAEAYKYIGTPYVWGGKDPSGFDCSGFTRYVYMQVTGRDIGGWTVPQESAGTKISVSQAKAGDLLFWGSQGGTYHVAIALGGGQYIHAPQPGESVKVGSVQWFAPDFAVSM
ncbi:C40 family peptidase, partial [Enterococcus faecium]|uniref:C40 family peptidase n=1 Tax=Enterococcus faecium TaxID=1352 RepID=UPI000B568792